MRALSQRAASGLAPPPTEAQSAWLVHGLEMPAGKLPLFDTDGQRIDERTVRCCLRRGWVEPWFNVPAVPDWLVCKLTPKGREIMAGRAG
ncbi:MAG: hypothetical protein O7C63_05505 [Alphaproteobacteria bacterium]|nr:hypothetical protein [Alphaproteobacteria bacterium]